MTDYYMTEEELHTIRQKVESLFRNRLLLPGAVEAYGDDQRRIEMVQEIIANTPKPENLHKTMIDDLREIGITLIQIEERHFSQLNKH